MRTEQEIKEQMKYEEEQMNFWFENANYTEYNKSYGAIEAFKFVLEESEPERTIFDLTEEELLELFLTAFPSLRESNVTLRNYIAKEKRGFVEFEIYFDNNDSWHINIFDDLSMYPYFNGENAIVKQANYIDRIREMLSKPKEEVK